MLIYLLGTILLCEACLLCLPLAVALIYSEPIMPFIQTIVILLAVSVPAVLSKPKNRKIYAREGFISVSLAWILLSLFGGLPFLFSGAIPSYIDCVFETVSGFTTTGSTILTQVEQLDRSILFWRSFTHWVGGMGVLVFVLAIIPSDGDSIHLLKAEVPGPEKGGKLVPKIRKTAKILYAIYAALTLIMIVCLLLSGQGLFESIIDSLATAGTGGFSMKNASIGGYGNPAAEWVIAVFMVLFGINFNLFYFALIGRVKDALKSEELKWYLALVFGCTAAIVVNLMNSGVFDKLSETVRHSFFQVATVVSTTGFATVNYEAWPSFSKTILLILTVTGACAGSTAGGLKMSRCIILLKNMKRELKHMLRPKSVNVIRLDGQVVSEETVRGAVNYLSIYVALIVFSVIIISIDNFGFTTNFTAVLTCINNVGPGLEMVGPAGNFSQFSDLSKIVLTLDMLIGRLEIMPMLILFFPAAWSVPHFKHKGVSKRS